MEFFDNGFCNVWDREQVSQYHFNLVTDNLLPFLILGESKKLFLHNKYFAIISPMDEYPDADAKDKYIEYFSPEFNMTTKLFKTFFGKWGAQAQATTVLKEENITYTADNLLSRSITKYITMRMSVYFHGCFALWNP